MNFDNDTLADHRRVIGRNLSGLTAAVLLLFGVLHLLGGRWAMALVNAVLMLVLIINARALQRNRAAPIPSTPEGPS